MALNILITGATGFIGSHLTKALLKSGHHLIILKRSFSNTDRLKKEIKFIKTYNVDKIGQLEKAFSENKIDCIIHLAALYIKQENSFKDIEDMINSNLVFPLKLLDLTTKYQIKYFINTGTCFEYKRIKTKTSEKTSIKPYNFYATTKLIFEDTLKYYCQKHNFKAITLKLFYPFGPNDNPKLVAYLIDSFKKNIDIDISPGNQILDYTYIDDIINAYLKTIKYISSKQYHQKYLTINIGRGIGIKVKDIAKLAKKLSKSKSKINFNKTYSDNEIMYMVANNQKAKKILNWYPKTSVKTALKKML